MTTRNTVYEAGCLASIWAVERMLTGQNEMVVKEASESRMMAQDGQEVLKVIRDYLGEDLLSEDNPYVPEFVRHALNLSASTSSETDNVHGEKSVEEEDENALPRGVEASTAYEDEWVVTTYRFVLHDVAVEMCTACTYEDAHDNELHLELFRTLIYGMDCLERAAYLVDQEARNEHPSSLRVVCYMLDEERYFPEKREPIGVENVNAGVTMMLHDGDERRVFVYRKEHAQKVLLHELAHAMGIDTLFGSDMDVADNVTETENHISNLLNWTASTNRFRIAEALVETVACYWHMMLHVPEHSLKNNLDSKIARNELWVIENAQYMASCAGVLSHYFPSTSSSAPKSKGRSRSRQVTESTSGMDQTQARVCLERVRDLGIEESAHVLAYYFVKTALWCRLDEVVLLPRRAEECNAFLRLVENSLTDPIFWKRLMRSSASDKPLMTALG